MENPQGEIKTERLSLTRKCNDCYKIVDKTLLQIYPSGRCRCQECNVRNKNNLKKWRERNKEHVKNYAKDYRKENYEKYLEYDKNRNKNNQIYFIEKAKRYYKEKGEEIRRKSNIWCKKRYALKKEEENFKKRLIAYHLSRRIPLKPICEVCNINSSEQRHHPDYNYPTLFLSVCKECHNKIHRKYNTIEIGDFLWKKNVSTNM
jgi:exonuclease VII large subunit